MRRLELIALPGLPMVAAGDDLAVLVEAGLAREGLALAPGDVLVLAQKIVSKAEGRSVALAEVQPTPEAEALAARTGKDPRFVQL
ncbi:MAG: coenzyme F420-0:L-glutamate ligase, partial [Acetobacteraceae bacterium]